VGYVTKVLHLLLQYFMPTLRKRRADLNKCINMYLEVLTSLAESRHERKAKMRSGLEPLADTSSHSPAASTMVEATVTAPNILHSQTGLVAPVETKQSVPNEQVGTSDPTCSHNSPAEAETLSSNKGVITSDPTQAQGPFAVNDIAQSRLSEPCPLDVIPMNESSLRPTRSLKQTAKRTYAPFASITSRASRREMNKDQPVLRDEECPPQLATSKDCREEIRNPSQSRNSVLLEWRNKPLLTRGLSPLIGPDNNDSERIANKRFIENLVRPNLALDVPSSRTGPIVPDEMKPSIPSERVGTDYPTYSHDHSEMIRNHYEPHGT
jgi:hypothetical protein